MKIGICVQYDSSFKSVADVTLPVLSSYCNRHGYALLIQQDPAIQEDIVQDRVRRLQAALPEYSWVAHFDADALVTNHTIKIESFLEKHAVVCKARAETGELLLADGIMFVRNTNEGRRFLGRIGFKKGKPIQELQAAYANEPEFRDIIKVCPQNAFSSFPYHLYGLPETTEGNWKKGDFILHVPVKPLAMRIEEFTNHLPEIIQ